MLLAGSLALATVVAACWPLGWLVLLALGGAHEGGPRPAGLIALRPLAVGVALAAWLAALLADLGLLRLLLFAAGLGLIAAGAAATVLLRHRLPPAQWLPHPRPDPDLLVLLLLTLVAVPLYFRPHETILGPRDPGVYYAIALAIAETGTLTQHDRFLADLARTVGTDALPAWFFYDEHEVVLRFPAQLFVRAPASGTVEPGFMPVYPAALALFLVVGGPHAGLLVAPLFATLALGAVYLAGRLLLDRPAALVGAALLLAAPPQLWFARYPMAETTSQWFLWCGLLGLALALRGPRTAAGGKGAAGSLLSPALWGRAATKGSLPPSATTAGVEPAPRRDDGVVHGWTAVPAAREPRRAGGGAKAEAADAGGEPPPVDGGPGPAPAPASLATAAGGCGDLLLAGLGFGLALLARIDAALALPTVAGAGALLWWRGRHAGLGWLAVVYAAALAHAALHALLVAFPYLALVAAPRNLRFALGTLVAVPLAVAGLWLLAPTLAPLLRRRLPFGGRPFWVLAAALWLAYGIYGYFLRPLSPLPQGLNEIELNSARSVRDALVQLGWYLTPPVLLLAWLGGTLLLWRGWRPRALLLLLFAAPVGAVYLRGSLASTDHPWIARRDVPVLFPVLLLLAGYLLAQPRRWPLPRPLGALVAVAASATATLLLLLNTGPLLTLVEHEGVVARIEALAARFPPDAVLIFPRSGASFALAMPLQYLGQRDSIALPGQEVGESLPRAVAAWEAAGRPVYWLTPAEADEPPREVGAVREGEIRFRSPALEIPSERPAREVVDAGHHLVVYRLSVRQAPPAP